MLMLLLFIGAALHVDRQRKSEEQKARGCVRTRGCRSPSVQWWMDINSTKGDVSRSHRVGFRFRGAASRRESLGLAG